MPSPKEVKPRVLPHLTASRPPDASGAIGDRAGDVVGGDTGASTGSDRHDVDDMRHRGLEVSREVGTTSADEAALTTCLRRIASSYSRCKVPPGSPETKATQGPAIAQEAVRECLEMYASLFALVRA